jgi:hypothetical protein
MEAPRPSTICWLPEAGRQYAQSALQAEGFQAELRQLL